MNRIINSFLVTSIAALVFAISPEAAAQETAAQEKTAPTGVLFRLGKAFNRAVLSSPRSRGERVDVTTRVHYANTVYAHEGQETAVKRHVASHGLFIHWNLDDVNPKAKPGHALAE